MNESKPWIGIAFCTRGSCASNVMTFFTPILESRFGRIHAGSGQGFEERGGEPDLYVRNLRFVYRSVSPLRPFPPFVQKSGRAAFPGKPLTGSPGIFIKQRFDFLVRIHQIGDRPVLMNCQNKIERACLFAVYHDVSEIYTGDLPTPIKYANGRIRDSCQEIETENSCLSE